MFRIWSRLIDREGMLRSIEVLTLGLLLVWTVALLAIDAFVLGGAIEEWQGSLTRSAGHIELLLALLLINVLYAWVLERRKAGRRLGSMAAQGRLLATATRDQETGLYTQHHFDERLAAEIELAEAYQRPFSLLAIGVDRLDSFRELHGDFKALQLRGLVAQVLREYLRVADVPASDGEHFLVLMPETGMDEAAVAYRRLQRLISDRATGLSDDCFRQATLSAGLFEYDGSRPPEILRAALWALERARSLGGNNLHRFTPGWSDWRPAAPSLPSDQPAELGPA